MTLDDLPRRTAEEQLSEWVALFSREHVGFLDLVMFVMKGATLLDNTLKLGFPDRKLTFEERIDKMAGSGRLSTDEIHNARQIRNAITHDAYIPGPREALDAATAFARADLTLYGDIDAHTERWLENVRSWDIQGMPPDGKALPFEEGVLFAETIAIAGSAERGIGLLFAANYIEFALLAVARNEFRIEGDLQAFKKLAFQEQLRSGVERGWLTDDSVSNAVEKAVRARNQYAHHCIPPDWEESKAYVHILMELARTLRKVARARGIDPRRLESPRLRDQARPTGPTTAVPKTSATSSSRETRITDRPTEPDWLSSIDTQLDAQLGMRLEQENDLRLGCYDAIDQHRSELAYYADQASAVFARLREVNSTSQRVQLLRREVQLAIQLRAPSMDLYGVIGELHQLAAGCQRAGNLQRAERLREWATALRGVRHRSRKIQRELSEWSKPSYSNSPPPERLKIEDAVAWFLFSAFLCVALAGVFGIGGVAYGAFHPRSTWDAGGKAGAIGGLAVAFLMIAPLNMRRLIRGRRGGESLGIVALSCMVVAPLAGSVILALYASAALYSKEPWIRPQRGVESGATARGVEARSSTIDHSSVGRISAVPTTPGVAPEPTAAATFGEIARKVAHNPFSDGTALSEPTRGEGKTVAMRLCDQGYRAYQHDQLTEAERLYEQALAANPMPWTRASLYYNLGLVARNAGDIESADQLFHMSLVLRPLGDAADVVAAAKQNLTRLTAEDGPRLRAGQASADEASTSVVTPDPSTATVRLVPSSVFASTFLAHHPPQHAFDGNRSTAWNEGAKGPGRGQWIEAYFPSLQRIKSIRLSTGYDAQSAKYGDLFSLNAHAKKIRILFDGTTRLSRDVDDPETRQVEFTGLDEPAYWVRFVFDDVWEGTKWNDLCISEIEIYGDPK